MTEFEQLKAAIDAKMSTNPQIRHILKLIESGKASFNDSAKYTQILSHLLGHELASQILELSDREGATTQLLRGAYDEVNDLCSQVQSSLDKKAGIGLNPKQAPFPAERVEQYAHSLVDPTVEDNVIKRRAGAGSETITKSYHDDFIETNAEFREDAGFKCYIVRMGTDCCQWCSDVAGKYEMKDQPQGIFRRHDNCDCTIIYDGQVLRGQTGAEGKRGKKWVEVPNKAGAADAVRFSQVQAKALNDKKVEINVPSVDIATKSGIIETEVKQEMNLVIDKFTPCLEDTKTGELVPTVYEKATKKDLSELKGWNFNWLDKDLKGSEIYKLCIVGDNTIQGLVAVTDYQRDMAVYVNIAESAPHNLGKGKKYSGVGGHLFAIAAKISYDKGYGGFLFMDAKNTELVEHYRNTLGAVLIGRPHPYRMIVDEENAIKLLNTYTFEEG